MRAVPTIIKVIVSVSAGLRPNLVRVIPHRDRTKRAHDKCRAENGQGHKKRGDWIVGWEKLLCDGERKISEYDEIKPFERVADRDCQNDTPLDFACSSWSVTGYTNSGKHHGSPLAVCHLVELLHRSSVWRKLWDFQSICHGLGELTQVIIRYREGNRFQIENCDLQEPGRVVQAGVTSLLNCCRKAADQVVNSFVFCAEHHHCTLLKTVRTRDVPSTQDSVSRTSP